MPYLALIWQLNNYTNNFIYIFLKYNISNKTKTKNYYKKWEEN